MASKLKTPKQIGSKIKKLKKEISLLTKARSMRTRHAKKKRTAKKKKKVTQLIF